MRLSTVGPFFFGGISIYSLLTFHSLVRTNTKTIDQRGIIRLEGNINHPSIQKHYRTIKHGVKNEAKRVEESLSLEEALESAPSVDYFACCGAGHRFSKAADSYYLAKQIGFSLRVFFGFCDTQEVYSYFFGPQPVEEVMSLTRGLTNRSLDNLRLKVANENPGFAKLIREGNNTTCRCHDDRLRSDVEYFNGIRNRFRDKGKVDAFRKKYFENHTVIGMHVRSGNGEEGDFVRKNRTIPDIDFWSSSMSKLLISLSTNFTEPPLLFIATDTAQIITNFQNLLQQKMPVIHLSQKRLDHGYGVLFGARGSVSDTGDRCLNGWSDSFSDMMLLSHADVVIAGRPSSFTQSLPMTMALSTPKTKRKVLYSFCEVNPPATAIMCFEDLKDWCCRGVTSFSLQSIQRYDYRRMPRVKGLDPKDYVHRIKVRSQDPEACIPKPDSGRGCLPYKMPDGNEIAEMLLVRKRGFYTEQWNQGMEQSGKL